jgi:hypothetical protein
MARKPSPFTPRSSQTCATRAVEIGDLLGAGLGGEMVEIT